VTLSHAASRRTKNMLYIRDSQSRNNTLNLHFTLIISYNHVSEKNHHLVVLVVCIEAGASLRLIVVFVVHMAAGAFVVHIVVGAKDEREAAREAAREAGDD
jgi:hypothetical protein